MNKPSMNNLTSDDIRKICDSVVSVMRVVAVETAREYLHSLQDLIIQGVSREITKEIMNDNTITEIIIKKEKK